MSLNQLASTQSGSLSIVHLNAYDHHGGAERLAFDLIDAQREAGHESWGLVGYKTRAESPAIAFEIDPDLSRRAELQETGWPDYEFRGSHRLVSHEAVQRADVIHVHNLYGGYFHPLSLIALSQFRPVVWSIHDMQAITGYCSHALDCPRWEYGCGECPDLNRPGPRMLVDNTAGLWRDKKMVSENSRLWLVGASEWMASQLRRSFLGQHPIQLIHNGIDTQMFRPADRIGARQKLGLPADALIVGSLARTGVFDHPWKGGLHARTTLEALKEHHPEMLFLNIGSGAPQPEPWIRSIAPITSELLRETLSALDFLLHPTLADTAPLAVIEAMACGLPVVGFRVGGVPDFVTESEGLLVPERDTAALIEASRLMAADAELRKRLGHAARERAAACFDRARMAQDYENLYREAISAHARESSNSNMTKSTSPVPSSLEEIRVLQGRIIGLETKLDEQRARREKDEREITGLLQHGWVRLSLSLGLLRGPVQNWLRMKEREHVKKAERAKQNQKSS